MLLDVHVISNTFIYLGFKESVDVSQMKLQRLLYLAYKEYLKNTNKKLFAEPFEKWKTGAVLNSIFSHYEALGPAPIKSFIRTAADGSVKLLKAPGKFAEAEAVFVVWEKYKNWSGEELSKMLTSNGSAWANTGDGCFLSDLDISSDFSVL